MTNLMLHSNRELYCQWELFQAGDRRHMSKANKRTTKNSGRSQEFEGY